jgi:hypothetical protein
VEFCFITNIDRMGKYYTPLRFQFKMHTRSFKKNWLFIWSTKFEYYYITKIISLKTYLKYESNQIVFVSIIYIEKNNGQFFKRLVCMLNRTRGTEGVLILLTITTWYYGNRRVFVCLLLSNLLRKHTDCFFTITQGYFSFSSSFLKKNDHHPIML